MKKIYSLIGVFALTTVFAQNTIQKPKVEKYTGTYFSEKKNKTKVQRTAVLFDEMVSPAEGILATKNVASTDYDYFLSPVLMDSTLKYSDGAGDYAPDNALGYVLDPASFFPKGDGTQVCTVADPYFVDSLFIPAVYRRVAGSTATDTLYTYVTVATTTPSNTPVNLSVPYSAMWIAPMASWSGTLNLMRVTNTPTASAHGNTLRPATAALPVTTRIKTLLTAATSTAGVGVKIPTPVSVGAGKVVAAYYTYVPGTKMGVDYNNGDINFTFTGGAPATQNGFCGIIAQQTAPVAAAADISDMFNCPDGTNNTLVYTKKDRYGMTGGVSTRIDHALLQDVIMEFHVYGGTTNVAELEKKGFALGQNTPNPFSNSSTVRFDLAKDVNTALFTVTDVMGRVISSENVGTTAGKHTVNLGAFAAGVYYYSLNVDGNVTTKKMIVE